MAARFRPPNENRTTDENNEQPPSEENTPVPQQTQQPQPSKEIITSCPRCGAPIPPNQEDVVFTCRYCGFTVAFAGKDEVRIHSMLENHLHVQQAVETAQKYMDEGIFRSDVAENARITNVNTPLPPLLDLPRYRQHKLFRHNRHRTTRRNATTPKCLQRQTSNQNVKIRQPAKGRCQRLLRKPTAKQTTKKRVAIFFFKLLMANPIKKINTSEKSATTMFPSQEKSHLTLAEYLQTPNS